MPQYIGSFVHEGERWYFDYSTIVDAPVSVAMTLTEYRGYYRKKHGTEGMDGLPARLVRADSKGCSSMDGDTLDDMLRCNRAGKGEKHLKVKQVLEQVMAARTEPNRGGDRRR